MLKLVSPDYHLRAQYAAMMDEWAAEGGHIAPWPLSLPYSTDSEFEAMLKTVHQSALGNGPAEFAPSTTYWAKEGTTGALIGAVNIRHYLTEQGYALWGHIGYGVRPSERRKGYAVGILSMALDVCRRMKLERAMLSCSDENKGSMRTIERCGGVLENRVAHENAVLLRYWIEL